MPQPKKEKEVVAKPANPFEALASDSEDDTPKVESVPVPVMPPSPSLRSWGGAVRKFPDQTVFSSPFNKSKRMTGGRRAKLQEDEHGWVSLKAQMEEKEEERPVTPLEVAYEPRTPPWFPEVAPVEPKEEATPVPVPAPLPELVLEERISTEEVTEMSAMAWAERIKKSLEKAEAGRTAKAVASKGVDEEFKEALGKLSFFRRPMAVSEK